MRLPSVMVVLAVAAGCSYAPPTPLESDPTFLALQPPTTAVWSPDTAPLLAIGAVSMSYRTPTEAVFPLEATATEPDVAAAESATRAVRRARFEEQYPTWWEAPIDGRELQGRLASLLARPLYDGKRTLPLLDPVSAAAESNADLLREEIGESADKRGAELVAHIDVLENRVSWLHRDGFIWWMDMALFWAGGVLPIAFVPDEVYEAQTTVRVTVFHARTRRQIFQKDYTGKASASLNHFQRGLDVSGLLGLHPFFFEPGAGDYGSAYAALAPHALKALESEIVRGLHETLPARADVHRALIREGTEEVARTCAVVVGYNGPADAKGDPLLRWAEKDAQSIASRLQKGIARSPDHVKLLTDVHATEREVLAALAELAPQLLSRDTLVFYFAGYGATDQNGAPELVLSGGRLPLRRLAESLRDQLVVKGKRPHVLFLLDTSFTPLPRVAARTQRVLLSAGGKPCDASTFLDALGVKENEWCVVSAAGARQAAYEIDAKTAASEHGYFTFRLLAALEGEAGTGGALSSTELFEYVQERVKEDASGVGEQEPQRAGTERPFFVKRRLVKP